MVLSKYCANKKHINLKRLDAPVKLSALTFALIEGYHTDTLFQKAPFIAAIRYDHTAWNEQKYAYRAITILCLNLKCVFL
jgi:hypothetical protein